MKLMLLLQSNQGMTSKEIAERFGVSRRTIFRDLKMLQEIDVPITYDKYSGYGIMPGYKIPPLMFTSKELATIMVGLSFTKSQVDQQLVEDAKSVELKIKNVVPGDLKEFMSSLERRTVVDPYLKFGLDKKEGGDWYLITSAISQQKRISFKYRSQRTDEITDRKIDPYLIVFFRDHWNVIGYSHLRDSSRNFLLDRMAEIEILDEVFIPKEEIDPEALIFASEETQHEIVVDVAKTHFDRFTANLPAKVLKKTSHKPNFFRLTFAFDNLKFINEWLLQFSDKVKIVSPQVLKQKRTELLEDLLAQSK